MNAVLASLLLTYWLSRRALRPLASRLLARRQTANVLTPVLAPVVVLP